MYQGLNLLGSRVTIHLEELARSLTLDSHEVKIVAFSSIEATSESNGAGESQDIIIEPPFANLDFLLFMVDTPQAQDNGLMVRKQNVLDFDIHFFLGTSYAEVNTGR